MNTNLQNLTHTTTNSQFRRCALVAPLPRCAAASYPRMPQRRVSVGQSGQSGFTVQEQPLPKTKNCQTNPIVAQTILCATCCVRAIWLRMPHPWKNQRSPAQSHQVIASQSDLFDYQSSESSISPYAAGGHRAFFESRKRGNRWRPFNTSRLRRWQKWTCALGGQGLFFQLTQAFLFPLDLPSLIIR